jgi:hypothetical protein
VSAGPHNQAGVAINLDTQVGVVVRDERVRAEAAPDRLVPVRLQGFDQRVGDPVVVFDEQHPHHVTS